MITVDLHRIIFHKWFSGVFLGIHYLDVMQDVLNIHILVFNKPYSNFTLDVWYAFFLSYHMDIL